MFPAMACFDNSAPTANKSRSSIPISASASASSLILLTMHWFGLSPYMDLAIGIERSAIDSAISFLLVLFINSLLS